MEKEIKRGYVKWTDSDGNFHKEPLADHPELLADASLKEQIQAEEAKRLNAAGEEAIQDDEHEAEKDQVETLAALKKAPDDVLTTGDLAVVDHGDGVGRIEPAPEVTAPASAAEEPKPSEGAKPFADFVDEHSDDNGDVRA